MMKPSWIKRSLVSSACLLLIAHANSASAIGLIQAYQAALANDPQHQGAKADYAAGKEYEVMGRSGLLPTLQYSFSSSKNKGETISPTLIPHVNHLTNQDYRSSTRNVSLHQTLFNLDSYAKFEQGVLQTRLNDAVFDSRSRDLMIRLANAYVEAKFAEDQSRLYTAQRDAYAEQRRMNDRMFEKGEGTKTDMLETQAKLDVSETMLLEAKDSILNARNVLAGIIGQEVTQLDNLRDDFSVAGLLHGTFDEWKSIAEKNNADMIAAKYSLEVAEKEITKSRAGHAPRLDLNASYNRGVSESVITQSQDNNIRSIGIQLVIPIYSGGYVNAATRQAVAHRDKAKSDLDATVIKTMVELRKQYNLVNSSATRIDALQKSVSSSTLLVEATKQSIKGGIRINADLLNAQQQLMNAKKDLAQARYTYLIAFLKLKVAAGVLGLEDLQTVAGFFSKD